MSPDLNSLPPSSSPVTGYPRIMTSTNGNGNGNDNGNGNGGAAAPPRESPSPSSRTASISLQAAATVNAGLQHEPTRRSSSSSISRHRQSPQTGRRRSTVLMNLQLNDPSLPGPGELAAEGEGHGVPAALSPRRMSTSPSLTGGDPHHNRAPSLGELHQELEAEQEAQVNRLLQMIRQQQLQLQQLQTGQGQSQTSVAAEDPTPTSERSSSVTQPNIDVTSAIPTPLASTPRSPVFSQPRLSFDMARDALHRGSRTPSRGASSPRMRSTSFSQEGEPHLSGVRDESVYYQAETQSLVRENQMLRHRIRELERQVNEAHASAAAVTREPAHHSHLTHATSVSEEDAAAARTSQPAVGLDILL
ncbi:Uu.00g009980.m01.CDS01 [Anthostomella pinea]|uniref:Uu.00g009980.m01.CDS01 n=1 Tax=Anthostomella pinea TaxID=933095 RepID=A0AAI8VXG2_9PEZI|nr:Uu.00g009980.m01.CDS01 [Anthostomella pinea]